MPGTTTFMQLAKPAANETADISVINDNMEKLDIHRHNGGPDGQPVKRVQAGTHSPLPSDCTAGSLYVATDTSELLFHNGTSWQSTSTQQQSSPWQDLTLASPWTNWGLPY